MTLNYFERLGLESSADPRAVRRAYARELKRIDHEKDVEAFQALREAYEGALRSIEEGAPKLPDLEPVESPRYEGVLGRLAHLQSLEQARQVLLDSRPLNLEECEAFETSVADLLSRRWQPGHEYLFTAACEVFYWDGRQLPLYLEKLDTLAGAIEDLKYLRMQPQEMRSNHARVIESLRREEMPGMADLARDVVMADFVTTLYPDLMYLTCAPLKVASWRKHLAQFASEVKRRDEKNNATSSHPLARVVPFIYIIAICAGIFLGLTDFKFSRKQETRQLTVMEMNWITRNVEPIVVDSPVEFEVRLNERGEISNLQVIGKPVGRIDHVAKAIRMASPYPDEYPRIFRVRFPYV